MGRLKLGILVSGRGSNLQSLIDASSDKDFPAEVAIVISNKPDAYALERAEQAGIQNIVISHKDFSAKSEFENAIQIELENAKIDIVCLAGFMRILSAGFVETWQGRIINIHPSLLPKHKGLDTHVRAIEAKDAKSGCTVHHVTADMDAGEIIIQKSLQILDEDTPETLAARVLQLEHQAYPEAIRILTTQLKAS